MRNWTQEHIFDSQFIRDGERTVCIVNLYRDDETKNADGSRTIRKVRIPGAQADADLICAAPRMARELGRTVSVLENAITRLQNVHPLLARELELTLDEARAALAESRP